MKNTPTNNHYVSRFLTKSWEFQDGTKRMLWFYDFKTKKINKASSKKLFAVENVFDGQIEDLFNKYIETPLAKFIGSLSGNESLEIKDWAIQRALHLVFLAQTQRFSEAKSVGAERGLTNMLTKGELFLDGAASINMQESMLVRLHLPPPRILFYPEIGAFPIALPDTECPTRWAFAFGIPITPQFALLMVPKSVDQEAFKSQPIWHYSVGLDNHAQRIIIPPFIVEDNSHQVIADEIESARKVSRELFSLVIQARQVTTEMYAFMGLHLEEVRGSLHKRMQVTSSTN